MDAGGAGYQVVGMIALLIGLLFYLDFTIYGPGAVSYAPLERVAERRMLNEWGLTHNWREYETLAAVPDCKLLNRSGWLIIDGKILTVKIVDCAQLKHRQLMIDRDLLADVNIKNLEHLRGWIVLR